MVIIVWRLYPTRLLPVDLLTVLYLLCYCTAMSDPMLMHSADIYHSTEDLETSVSQRKDAIFEGVGFEVFWRSGAKGKAVLP